MTARHTTAVRSDDGTDDTGDLRAAPPDDATDRPEAEPAPDTHLDAIDGPDAQPHSSEHASEVPSHDDDGRRQRFAAAAVLTISVTAMIVALIAGYLKYQAGQSAQSERAGAESTQVAKNAAVAMLSYTPDTAQSKLVAASDLLTGPFRDSYTALTHDVVIPGAREKQISATATVAAAASISATPTHAVALVFVNQTIVMGTGAPTQSTSVVQVTLDKVADRWLVSGFDPK